jgi:hypothetical protein
MGIDDEAGAIAGLAAFTKCLRDYLHRRRFPALWIYCHERSNRTGWHTHLALHLPVLRHQGREECMAWLRQWPSRQTGRRVKKAIRLRVPKEHDTVLHWLLFNYLAKGYDAKAVVQSARYAPDGKPIMLGDLIAFRWRDPGAMDMRSRIGSSRTLGPQQQDAGIPAPWTGIRRVVRPIRILPSDKPVPMPQPTHLPFRSTFDDGIFDVRKLYGEEFCDLVRGGADVPPTVPEVDVVSEEDEEMGSLARALSQIEI